MDITPACPGIITVVVDGGIVQSVYTTIRPETIVEIEILDFDYAKANGDNPDALDAMRKCLQAVENKQRQIY
jgi:hypothetical protein